MRPSCARAGWPRWTPAPAAARLELEAGWPRRSGRSCPGRPGRASSRTSAAPAAGAASRPVRAGGAGRRVTGRYPCADGAGAPDRGDRDLRRPSRRGRRAEAVADRGGPRPAGRAASGRAARRPRHRRRRLALLLRPRRRRRALRRRRQAAARILRGARRRGVRAFEDVCGRARRAGLLVIADGARDIGSTARAYATAYLESGTADALTVNPYLGSDSLEPFLQACRRTGAGIFCLVKTSNAGGADVQDLTSPTGGPVAAGGDARRGWGEELVGEHGLSNVGAVVGATHPRAVGEARRLMPQSILLLPGWGARRDPGDARRSRAARERARGRVRSVMYAGRDAEGDDWRRAAGAEAQRLARGSGPSRGGDRPPAGGAAGRAGRVPPRVHHPRPPRPLGDLRGRAGDAASRDDAGAGDDPGARDDRRTGDDAATARPRPRPTRSSPATRCRPSPTSTGRPSRSCWCSIRASTRRRSRSARRSASREARDRLRAREAPPPRPPCGPPPRRTSVRRHARRGRARVARPERDDRRGAARARGGRAGPDRVDHEVDDGARRARARGPGRRGGRRPARGRRRRVHDPPAARRARDRPRPRRGRAHPERERRGERARAPRERACRRSPC